MTNQTYATNQLETKNTGRAVIKDADISFKTSVEICNFIRGKNVDKAIRILEDVLEKTQAIPFKVYNRNIGHVPGMGSARYPQKASKIILQLLKDAKANAINKGLSSDLIIAHLVPNKAAEPHHYGRQRGTKMKRSHVEVILSEKKVQEKKVEKKENKKPKGDNN